MRQQTTSRKFLQRFVAIARLPYNALFGLRQYRKNGRISPEVWNRLLSAHCASNGRATRLLNVITRMARPPRKPHPVTGLLGHFSVERQNEIVSAIARDGFYVFPEIMPAEFVGDLQDFAARTPAAIETNQDGSEPLISYDPTHPVSRTYKIQEQDALRNVQIQRLIADPVFVSIAESYLRTLPAIGGINVWWSARYGNQAGSEAAQLFHFDFDAPPAWLKLFVYITEVTSENGPHVYVKGSHKAGLIEAREFLSRGYERISDDEMELIFGAERLVEISGIRGTVFMADTRGFHKGKFPTGGDRLIAQVIYCSPIFNDHGNPGYFPEKLTDVLSEAVKTAPEVYERFMGVRR